ncbi:MAG TPA: 3-beta hydroxysteroid dehydrogenase [Bacteroidetes bacterium]|nr:3-beta hydroxysteroid dehydrogenase [Bacteroidota bacterium]
MQKVLVTGGTGFLGQHILKRLLKEGLEIRAIYRVKKNSILTDSEHSRIDWVKGDVLDIFSLEEAMKDCDTVIHGAALVSFFKKDELQMMKVNIEGTANVVNECLSSGVKKLLHISSVASLGRNKSGELISEKHKWEDSKLNTRYALSKYKSEMEIWRGVAEGLNAVVICPTMIFGTGDWNENTCRLFTNVENGLKGYPTGTNGMTDARDVAEIAIQLLKSEIVNERFVICGTNKTYKDFFSDVADRLNKPRPSIKVSPAVANVGARVLSLLRLFGKTPVVSVESARVASNHFLYDGSAVASRLNFKYTDFSKTIEWICDEFIKSNRV